MAVPFFQLSEDLCAGSCIDVPYFRTVSAVPIRTSLRARRPRNRSIPGRDETFLFNKASRSALGPTETSVQWVPGAFVTIKRLGCETDHTLHLRMRGAKLPFPVCFLGMMFS